MKKKEGYAAFLVTVLGFAVPVEIFYSGIEAMPHSDIDQSP
jgi:hypothetical protein